MRIIIALAAALAATPSVAEIRGAALGASVCGSALEGSGMFASEEPLAPLVRQAGLTEKEFCGCVAESFSAAAPETLSAAALEMGDGRSGTMVRLMATGRAACMAEIGEADEGDPDFDACMQTLSGEMPVEGVDAAVLRSRAGAAGFRGADLCHCAAGQMGGETEDEAIGRSENPAASYAIAVVAGIEACIPVAGTD